MEDGGRGNHYEHHNDDASRHPSSARDEIGSERRRSTICHQPARLQHRRFDAARDLTRTLISSMGTTALPKSDADRRRRAKIRPARALGILYSPFVRSATDGWLSGVRGGASQGICPSWEHRLKEGRDDLGRRPRTRPERGRRLSPASARRGSGPGSPGAGHAPCSRPPAGTSPRSAGYRAAPPAPTRPARPDATRRNCRRHAAASP